MRRIRCRSRRVNPPARIPISRSCGRRSRRSRRRILVEVGVCGQTPRAWETLRYCCDRPRRIRNLSSVPAHATMACIRRPQRWSNAFVAPASKGGGMRAASHGFLQAFPNLDCFCPSFSKHIFGRFVRFQGVASLPNRKCGVSKSFVARRPLPAPFRPPRTTFRRLASHGSEAGRCLAGVYGEVGQGARS
jgi:hypothetical protein